jgi:hypothetical protein
LLPAALAAAMKARPGDAFAVDWRAPTSLVIPETFALRRSDLEKLIARSAGETV